MPQTVNYRKEFGTLPEVYLTIIFSPFGIFFMQLWGYY